MKPNDAGDVQLIRRAGGRVSGALSNYLESKSAASKKGLAVRFGGLKESQMADKLAVSASLGKLLRRAILALLREDNDRR